MICPKCGYQNRDDATNCHACGALLAATPQPSAGMPPAGPVPNYFWAAVLTTVFCFFPFGILAMVYSIRVNSSLARGDYETATQASSSARMWCWVSLVLGLVFYAVVIATAVYSGLANLR